MLGTLLAIVLFLCEIVFGYAVPITLWLDSIANPESAKNKRWITHFLYLSVLNNTIFCLARLFGCCCLCCKSIIIHSYKAKFVEQPQCSYSS
jgi:hypothetical protein